MTLYRLKGTKDGKQVELYLNAKTGKIAYAKGTKLGVHVTYISPTAHSRIIELGKVKQIEKM